MENINRVINSWCAYGVFRYGILYCGLSCLSITGDIGYKDYHIATYTRDAIYMSNNIIGNRTIRSYGYIMNSVIVGGIYCIVGTNLIDSSNWSVATYTRDAIYMHANTIATREWLSYGRFYGEYVQQGLSSLNTSEWITVRNMSFATYE
ncbi:MAG: hypothetical protein IJ880_10795 [Bacilli bacterium]|nr:hypothetical protein [Bacilli bacterium]